MTPEQVKEIVRGVLKERESISEGLLRLVPSCTTREACTFLECSRRWIFKNKDLFEYRIKNMRGDLEFTTASLVEYKLKNQ